MTDDSLLERVANEVALHTNRSAPMICRSCGQLRDDFISNDGFGRCGSCSNRHETDGYINEHVSATDRGSFTWLDRLERINATPDEMWLVWQAAESTQAYRKWMIANYGDYKAKFPGPTAEEIIDGAGIPWRRQVALLDATIILCKAWGVSFYGKLKGNGPGSYRAARDAAA